MLVFHHLSISKMFYLVGIYVICIVGQGKSILLWLISSLLCLLFSYGNINKCLQIGDFLANGKVFIDAVGAACE